MFCTDLARGTAEPRRVEKVGFRHRWWGRDGRLTAEVERILSSVESAATPLLRDPDSSNFASGTRNTFRARLRGTRSPPSIALPAVTRLPGLVCGWSPVDPSSSP